jgi:hypothetical protein
MTDRENDREVDQPHYTATIPARPLLVVPSEPELRWD